MGRAAWLAARMVAPVSERAAGPFAARGWFTPWSLPLPESERRRREGWLAGTSPLVIRGAGTELAAFVAGEGPAVLMVHGWGERAAALGAFVEPLVAAGHRVVGVDLPAHGGSPGRRTDAFAWAQTITDAATAVDARVVVAHSMGAATTLLAAGEGLRTDGLVLLAPVVRLEHAVATFARTYRLPPRVVRALRGQIERDFGADVWRRLASDRNAANLGVPGLVFHDRDDPQVDIGDAYRLASAWRGAELVLTHRLGHNRLPRAPQVIERVVAFASDATSVGQAA
jgi:pimeloyl-ACP methyl ester carboxylesterase